MIESVSMYTARRIKKANPGGPSEEVMAYGMGFVLNFLCTVALTIIFGAITGSLRDALIAMVAFGILRFFSGGFHLTSLTLCAVVSAGLFTTIAHVHVSTVLMVSMSVVSSGLLLAFSPNLRDDSNIPVQRYPVMKAISAVIPLTNILIMSGAVGAAFLAQTVLVIPWGEVKRKWKR